MPTYLSAALGAVIRWALMLVLAPLVSKGILTDGQTSDLVIGVTGAVIVLLWSLYQKYGAQWWAMLALQQPAGTTPAELGTKVDTGMVDGPTAKKVITSGILLAIGLGFSAFTLAGCGKHVVTGPPDAVTAHYGGEVMDIVIDIEKTMIGAKRSKTLPVAITDKVMAGAAKAAVYADQLSVALEALHAATDDAARKIAQGNVTDALNALDQASAEIFEVKFPDGFVSKAQALADKLREAILAVRRQFVPAT